MGLYEFLFGEIPLDVQIIISSNLPIKIDKRIKINQKQCYDNAIKICKKYPEIEYVEGEVLLGEPISGLTINHAWNSYKDLHFDMTFEKYKINVLSYFPIVKGTLYSLTLEGYKFDSYMDLFTQYINKPENKSRIIKR
jgi:hypothetical protein